MRAALHRAAKKENHRRGAAPRASAHASRWADDELAEHAPRPPRLRAERRAWQRPLSGRSRVGQACHYGYDAHGNVTFLTDATGAVTDAYDYDAWGMLVAGTGSTPNTRLFAGEEFDPDLGLINLRARQYRPGTGRFLTLDPVMGSKRQPVTLNRYLYGDGDPVGRIDPAGTMAIEYAIPLIGVAGVLVGAVVIANPRPAATIMAKGGARKLSIRVQATVIFCVCEARRGYGGRHRGEVCGCSPRAQRACPSFVGGSGISSHRLRG